jgi:WD40 repeat protein/serine/threonine protein kinase
MSKKSTFGARPEQLNRLLSVIGLDKSNTDEQSNQTASLKTSAGKLSGQIGRYKLLRVLGEGGMGIVCLAEQEQPIRRQVALKIIKPGMDSSRVIARFEAERQALALLDHPNIAHVHDAGTTENSRPYFVMEYVKGLPITEHCDRHKLTIEDRLKLFLQVSHAIHHAHQKGIIHRDIKPSNILVSTVDDQVIPKIIDFGVAKAVTQPLTEQTLFTEDSQLLGTPEYMSPEQADMASEDIDIRSDIYSLGVLLYVLLTGVLPFDSDTLRDGGLDHVRKVIRETDPKTPSTRLTKLGQEAQRIAQNRCTEVSALTKRLKKELEWIPLKAMRKERSERYRSAAELADDIENYLKGNPLIAGPPGTVYRTKKFVRRHKALVTGIAAVLVVLLAGIVVSTIFAIGQARARAQAYKQQQLAVIERDKAQEAELLAERARNSEQKLRELTEQQAEVYRRSLYVRNINLADKYYSDGKISRVRDLLKACPEDLRKWEWYYLWRVSDQSLMTLRGHEGPVRSVDISPDGRRIVSGSSDTTLKVWGADSGNELMTLRSHEAEVWSVAFSPDGRRIVSGSSDTTLKVWDADSGNELMTLSGHEAEIWSVAFSPDGNRIVSGSSDTTLKVWDADNGNELMTLRGHEGRVMSVAFSPDGRRIVSGSWDLTLKVWDANDGSMLKTIGEQRLASIYSVAFSPDGRQIVVGGFRRPIKVFDANNYSELKTLTGGGICSSIAFSPDGSRMTAGNVISTFKLWDAVSSSEIMALKGHTDRVWSVAFSPDGRRIVSGSSDRTIKVWDLNSISYEMTLRGHEGNIYSVAFSPDGGQIVSGSGDMTLKVWDANNGSELMTLLGHEGYVWSVAFGPDGNRIVSGSGDTTLKVWDANKGKELMTLRGHKDPVRSVAFSPYGRRIVSGSWDSTLKVWDASDGKELISKHEGASNSAAFSPDGRRIVSVSGDGALKVKVWDAYNCNELMTLHGHEGWISSVAFSPDGNRIVSGSGDTTLKVWDANKGEELMTLRGHEEFVRSVAFSPDGKRIVSCGDDKTLKLWDAESGNELVTLHGHMGYVMSVAFSPNGRRIVSAGYDRTLKIWDIASPEEVEAELLAEEKGLSWIRRD